MLVLGGFAFTDYSAPEVMMGGGRQAMIIHKLPGGMRVIDTLGPDEASIAWRGQFFSPNALADALTLDGMRASGEVTSLQWGGMSRTVIIDDFIYRARRLPMWVEYAITVVVVQNPMQGQLGGDLGDGVDAMVTSDLGQASGS